MPLCYTEIASTILAHFGFTPNAALTIASEILEHQPTSKPEVVAYVLFILDYENQEDYA
jgi:hypothetical protein